MEKNKIVASIYSLRHIKLNHFMWRRLYNNVESITAFANKPALRDIQIYHNSVSDISPLFGNLNMKIVGIKGKGNVPCSQIYQLRKILPLDAKIWGQKFCD